MKARQSMRPAAAGAVLAALLACAAAGAAATPAQQADAMAAMHHDDAPVASAAARQTVAAGTVEAQTVEYGSTGGVALRGYLARPAHAAGALPGVILFHEWWGLNDNIRSMADQLAAQGYVALAADLYGGSSATVPEQAQALMKQALADMPAADANMQAAYAYLKDHAHAARVGTLGWCFGGSMSFEAAQLLGDKLGAVVIYYGFVNDDQARLERIKAPVLGLFGGQDQGIPPATAQAFEKGLQALGRSVQVRIYPDAGHAFANPSGKNYRKDAAEDAWRRTLEFLDSNLKR